MTSHGGETTFRSGAKPLKRDLSIVDVSRGKVAIVFLPAQYFGNAAIGHLQYPRYVAWSRAGMSELHYLLPSAVRERSSVDVNATQLVDSAVSSSTTSKYGRESRPPPQSQTTRRQEFFRDEPDDTDAEEKQEEALLGDVSVFVDMETPLRRRDVRLSDEPEKARAFDVNFTSWGTSFGPGESKKRGRAP
ncbi:hypothetical protein RUM44_007988 [Polyplax serrata]|uniref:Uncharacterized protein n=1 Tax=Polyplax serrata TaxID=468196 RepID=A0ABR1B7I7_POLSC